MDQRKNFTARDYTDDYIESETPEVVKQKLPFIPGELWLELMETRRKIEANERDSVLVSRELLANHIQQIDSWNSSMEKVIGKQLDYRWESLEELRSLLEKK